MPSWGRPSGARQGKMRKGEERRARQWEEDRRFEEIDSDDGERLGVNIDGSFTSDELYFTGGDIGPRYRKRRIHENGYSSELSEEENDTDDRSAGTMQLALRDKEKLLVQTALERIRRAQMLGRTNVKLTQPEIDALKRKRQKDQTKTKSKGAPLKITDRRRTNGYSGGASKDDKYEKRKSSGAVARYENGGSSSPGRATPPGLIVPGPNGVPSYAPFGYYPAPGTLPQGRSSRSGSRSASSHSKQQVSPPLPQDDYRAQPRRYVSVPEPSWASPTSHTPPLSRRLPDDPNWIPRPRSASSTQVYPVDPLQYQTYSPPLPQISQQYGQGRRMVSGPPDVQYSTVRRGLPTARPYAASSEPSLLQKEYFGEEEGEASEDELNNHEGDSEYDEDENDGVQVDVAAYEENYKATVGYGERRGQR